MLRVYIWGAGYYARQVIEEIDNTKAKILGILDYDERKQGSRMEIIVAFLVILELMKVGRIQIRQEHIFDEIIITHAKAA